VILIDANLLIYSVDSNSPHHAAARKWLERSLSGTDRIGLAWIVVLAFLRVTTRASILHRPLSAEAAIGFVDSWLQQPFVRLVAPGENHWPIFRNLWANTGTAGNLTSDTHLAALAIEHGASVASTDHDFRRFPGIDLINPLD
jgi:toxin-antitoxin system PIN domain toxin